MRQEESIDDVPNGDGCHPGADAMHEIHALRTQSTRLADAIQHEVVTLHERKHYVKAATKYINDRIGELNQVKGELADQIKLIELQQAKLQELDERQKQIKIEDVLNCIHNKNKVSHFIFLAHALSFIHILARSH